MGDPSIEQTFQRLLPALWPAAHVERWTSPFRVRDWLVRAQNCV